MSDYCNDMNPNDPHGEQAQDDAETRAGYEWHEETGGESDADADDADRTQALFGDPDCWEGIEAPRPERRAALLAAGWNDAEVALILEADAARIAAQEHDNNARAYDKAGRASVARVQASYKSQEDAERAKYRGRRRESARLLRLAQERRDGRCAPLPGPAVDHHL